jgi:hypothetical protein
VLVAFNGFVGDVDSAASSLNPFNVQWLDVFTRNLEEGGVACEFPPTALSTRIGIQYYPHANQVRQASRLQLLDNVGAMQLNGAKADAEMAGDDLVGLARGHQLEDLTFARRQ